MSRSMNTFEVLDHQADQLKWNAKMLGTIGAVSSLGLTFASGGGQPNSDPVYSLSNIPVWVMILGTLVCVASITLSVYLCKLVNKKTADKKKSLKEAVEQHLGYQSNIS